MDVVLTDLRVPQLGGLEAIAAPARECPTHRGDRPYPIRHDRIGAQATRIGAADYVTKPFHIPDLRGKLDRACCHSSWIRKTAFFGNSFAPAQVSAA